MDGGTEGEDTQRQQHVQQFRRRCAVQALAASLHVIVQALLRDQFI